MVKNFKCFDDSMFYEFNILDDRSPILLSGPNGFGKTSFYDAIELILSNSITRYNRDIERQNANLKGNILLNDKTKDGYIVMCLVSDSNNGMNKGLCNRKYLTIFAKISKDIKNIKISGTIVYKWTFEEIETGKLDKWLYDENWHEDLDPKILLYNKGNFNLLYYISQAESAHFLHNSLNKRKEEIDTLLDINWAIDRKDFIAKLISKSNNHFLYKKINDLKSQMNMEISNYLKIKERSNEIDFRDVEYESLGLLENDKDFFSWDAEFIEENFLDENIRKLETLIKFLENYESFKIYTYNKEIRSINQEDIKNYLCSYEFIENGEIQNEKMKCYIEDRNRTVQLYYSSKFIRNPIDLDLYNKSDIESLKKLVKGIDSENIDLINRLVEEIKLQNKDLNSDEKIITELDKARNKLKDLHIEYNVQDKERCPYCNTKFNNYEELDKNFRDVESNLRKRMNEKQARRSDLFKELGESIEIVRKEVNNYIGNISESKIKDIESRKNTLQTILNDQGLISTINKIADYLDDKIDDNNKDITSIQTLLSKKLKKIESEEFNKLNIEYKFEKFYRNNKRNIEYVRVNIVADKLNNKLSYLEKLLHESKNHELLDSRAKIKEMIKEEMKYIKISDRLGEIKKIYGDLIESFKQVIIKNISIPLLIYTGKLLQEYQSGLGVFIDNEEFRFISDGATKHDILNTFSSGQTSAFVISFMLAMNKLYVGDDDQLGFLLIDDPVQTMDDINMASLVELLRNEFDDKQIILSTHEFEKENYILYKFLKYGQMGQSFNVKDELYGY